jgi:hypothetical protein
MGFFDKVFKDEKAELFNNFINYEDPKKIFSVQLPAIYSPDKPLESLYWKINYPDGAQISFGCSSQEDMVQFLNGDGTFQIYIYKDNSKSLDDFYKESKKYISAFLLANKQWGTTEPIIERILLSNNPAIKISYQTKAIHPQYIKSYECILLCKKGEYLFRLGFASKEGKYLKKYLDNIPKICESFKILK